MRWPWQSATAKATETSPTRDDRQSPAGWAFFPPIQRIVGDQPTLTRTDAFTRSLPAWGNPSLMGTMGHLVSSDGPSGVLDGDGGGLGAPQLTAFTPELPLLPPRSSALSRQGGGSDTVAEADPGGVTDGVGLSEIKRPVADRAVTETDDRRAPDLTLPLAPMQRESVGGRGTTATDSSITPSAPTGRSSADPRFNENATNDGYATIVSLPTARPLQRKTDEPVVRPMVGEPGERRLGLGRPLVSGAQSPTGPSTAPATGDSLPLMPAANRAEVTATDVVSGSQDESLMAEASAVGPTAFQTGPRQVESGWAPSPRSMPVLPVASTATGLLSTQRMATAGLERSMAPRASSGSSTESSASLRMGGRGSWGENIIQRATVLAPGAPEETEPGRQITVDRSDETPEALATALRPVRATDPAPTSTPSTAVLQRDFGGLPLSLPKESGLREAVSSAESKAKSEAAGDVARAETAVAPAESAAAELVTAANAGAAAVGSGTSSQDVDALAEKLMIPLLRRFKSEMLLDRERRGLRTDAF